MNPYPGLRPFRQDETRYYQGREGILDAVSTRLFIDPLMVMYARSGVGKSSFLTCRLTPALSARSQVMYLNEWGSGKPSGIIAQAIIQMQVAEQNGAEPPVLILDQFEDVFKFPYDRGEIWDRLAEIVNIDEPNVHVLVCMREEWLGAWAEATDYLPLALTALERLAPLTDKELRRAIQRPAQLEGTVEMSDALVPVLIEDLKQPNAFGLGESYVEPGLLQLVCNRLWEEANNGPARVVDLELYERFGRADRIIREFVWNELGSARNEASRFSSRDRVLWVGLTRYLTVAHGVKAVISPSSVSRKLQTQDLGLVGPAVLASAVSGVSRKYLQLAPEKRSDPPLELAQWITDVLRKGAAAGFLKQQRATGVGGDSGASRDGLWFELAHDSLGDIFVQFAIEFESWIRARWAKFVGLVFGALVGLPFIVIQWIQIGPIILLYMLGGVLVAALYMGMLWVFVMIGRFLGGLVARFITHPIMRWLAQGRVPIKGARRGGRADRG